MVRKCPVMQFTAASLFHRTISKEQRKDVLNKQTIQQRNKMRNEAHTGHLRFDIYAHTSQPQTLYLSWQIYVSFSSCRNVENFLSYIHYSQNFELIFTSFIWTCVCPVFSLYTRCLFVGGFSLCLYGTHRVIPHSAGCNF